MNAPPFAPAALQVDALRRDLDQLRQQGSALALRSPGLAERLLHAAAALDGLALTVEDLRRQNQALQAAQAAERTVLAAVMEHTHAHLAYIDAQFRFVHVNAAYARGAGHTREELLGRNHFELFPNAGNEAIFARVRDTGEPVRFTAKPFAYADQPERGTTYWDWTLVPVKDAAGQVQGLVLSLLDVTEDVRVHQRVEELAAEAQQRAEALDAIFSAMADGVLVYDAAGTVVQANPAAVATLGFDPVGQERTQVAARLALRHPNGRPAEVEDLPTTWALRGVVLPARRFVGTGAGGREVSLLMTAAPLCGADAVAGAVAVWHDVTAREQEIARRKVAEAERERLLAELAAAVRTRDAVFATVTHDLRNPLQAIRGWAQLLRRRLDQPGSAVPAPVAQGLVRGLEQILGAAGRLAGQLDELVDVARLQAGRALELDRRPTDLVALAHEAAAEWAQRAESHRFQVEATVPALVGNWDATRLRRVLDNLLANAAKYSPAGGEVRLAVAQAGEGSAAWAVLAVHDQGLGIPPTDMPFLFEPFRRGSNVAGRIAGTGLGLASVRHIVESHGGTVAAASEEGVGSVFTVRLPLASGEY